MKYRCSKCGEELMGAVNRCWKCGQPFTAPVSDAASESAAVEPPEGVFIAQFAEASAVATPPAGPIRVGSPFAGSSRAAGEAPLVLPKPPPVRTVYPQNAAALGGAYAAVFLGTMSLLVCLAAWDGVMLAAAALLIAFLGLIMGAWGLSSDHRKTAGVGLLLCVLAVSLSSIFTARNAYRESQVGQLGEKTLDSFGE